jgi:anti-anti-sigma factor
MSTRYSQLASLDKDMNDMQPLIKVPLDLATADVSSVQESTGIDSLVRRERAAEVRCIVLVNLPRQVTAKQARSLIRDVREQLNVDQPCVVLDLSDVKEMDTAGLDVLLECLNETVRRDGTIQVRGISPEAATILELTGMDEILGWTPAADSPSEISTDYVPEVLHSSYHSLVA